MRPLSMSSSLSLCTDSETLTWAALDVQSSQSQLLVRIFPKKILPEQIIKPIIYLIIRYLKFMGKLNFCFNKYSLKQVMNKINQRVQSNSRLLNILCKRDSNKMLFCKEDQWPGKRRPSFAANIRIKKQTQTPGRLLQKSERKSNGLYRKSSQKRLLLTKQITNSAKSLSLVPKKDFLSTLKEMETYKFETESERQLGSLNNEAIKSRVSKRIPKDELNDYEIDYIAFNYIGKVIDNPELWVKFVHKKLTA